MTGRERKEQDLIPDEVIEKKILLIRGEKIMLDRDLATLYGVTTGTLNQAVKRNAKRFPPDFMFQLNSPELSALISQFVISKPEGRGGVRKLPYAFTENGVAMLSSVLNSDRAIQVNIQIMRTFTRLKKLLASHKEILRHLTKHELKLIELDKRTVQIFEVINKILNPPSPKETKRIGFLPPEKR
jgi:hypothetical protein